MNYWHLTWVIAALLACGVLIYAALRTGRVPEALRVLVGYRGPKDLLKRALMNLLWTMVAMVGLVLIGLLFKVLKLP